NAGVEGSIVVGKVLDGKDAAFGFNAQTEEYGDLVKMGVIDPAKVVRTALQDAASVAGILITTEAAVADAPKKPGAGAGAPDMGGMDFESVHTARPSEAGNRKGAPGIRGALFVWRCRWGPAPDRGRLNPPRRPRRSGRPPRPRRRRVCPAGRGPGGRRGRPSR